MRDVGSILFRSAERHPHRTAVEGPDGQRTYAELATRVTAIARGLRGLGLSDGTAVLDLQHNAVTALETDLAVRAAGLVRVALNPRLHARDWLAIANDCAARVLIVEEALLDRVAELADDLTVVVVGTDGPLTLDGLASGADGSRIPAPDPAQLCGMHYSSGTTGAPKGARRTHANWWQSLVNMTHDVLRLTPGSSHTYVHAGPMTHTSGLFILPFLCGGARQIILPKWDPEAFVNSVENRGATHTALVPTMIARLLSDPEIDRDRLQGLQMLGYAGAPMPIEHVRLASQRLTPHLVQYYGLVEAIPPVTVLSAEDHQLGLRDQPQLLTSAGHAALGVEMRIVDDKGEPLPPGEVGEVITRGDHVMPGYHNAGSRTDLGKSLHDGWLYTGDLGRMDPFGRLWLIDRRGDMIISGGYNIYPREIEDVISTVPGVAEVAVLGMPDDDWGQRVVALYTEQPGMSVAEDSIVTHCREHLASYKKPKEIRLVASLPVTANGKIAKKVLREQLEGAR